MSAFYKKYQQKFRTAIDIKDVRERIDGLADRVSRPEGLIEGLLRPRPVIAPNAPD